MYKCLVVVLFLITNVLVFSKEMAVLPFEGKDLTEEAGKAIADGFINELGALGYSLISGSPSELKAYYKQLGDKQKNPMLSKEEAGKVGKQLGADWVLIGEFRKFNETITISAKIIDVETSQIIASSSGKLKMGYDILIEDIVGELDAKIKGKDYVSQEEKEKAFRQQQQTQQRYSAAREQEELINSYNTANIVKWTGRSAWILGSVMMFIPIVIDWGYGGTGFYFLTMGPSEPIVTSSGFLPDGTFVSLGGDDIPNSGFSGAPAEYYEYSANALNGMRGVFYTGIALFVLGGITDIVASVTGSKLKKELISRDIYVNLSPIMMPTANGKFAYGGQFRFSYKF